jgi:hypothetical protein
MTELPDPDFGPLLWQRAVPDFTTQDIRFGGGIASSFGDLLGVVKDTNDMIPFRVYQLDGEMFRARYQRWLCRREVPAALTRRRELDLEK